MSSWSSPASRSSGSASPADGAAGPGSAPSADGGDADFGVYVHIPFCAKRCDYCAFATWTDRDPLIGAYMGALIDDVRRPVASGMPLADTVFVGGGTPTHVPPRRLAEVLDAIPRAPGAEITVECNPDDVTVEMMH